MNFRFISLFLQLVLSHSTVSQSILDWKSSLFTATSLQQTAILSPQCFNETSVFVDALKEVGKVVIECLNYKNCTMDELMSMKDYVFAIQQFDAFGKLPPDLLDVNTLFEGSYEECRRVSGKLYPTNYCYLTIRLGRNASCDFISSGSSNITPRLAVCMPMSCHEKDLSEVFNQLTPIPLTACAAYCSDGNVERGPAFWMYTLEFTAIVCIVASATVVEYFREREIGMSAVNEQAYLLRVFLSFSMWSNSDMILSVKEHKPGYIRSLDCLRTLSMLWIISAHSYNFLFPYNIVGDSEEFLHDAVPSRHLILNAFFSIDTFLVLSGVVVAYLFFRNKPKRGGILEPATWIVFYIHRYIRLTPPIMMFIGFFTVYAKFLQGPFAASELDVLRKESEICETNWWKNLFYINNFGESSCYSITWFLALDTQLYFIAPVFLVSLFFSFIGGVVLIIITCIISILLTYFLFGALDLPADFIGNGKHDVFREAVHQMPWVRCSPFLIGLFVGYVLATFTKTRLKFHWIVPVFGWITSLTLAIGCLLGNYFYDMGTEWNVFQRATYYSFSRIGWSLFVSWIVTATHYGWGGPLGAFICHPIWQPFGRLSFCAYIVHRMVLFWFYNLGTRSPVASSAIQMFLYHSLPVTFLSYVAAFFWSAIFEVPVVRIEKIFIEPYFFYRRESTKAAEEKVRVRRGAVI